MRLGRSPGIARGEFHSIARTDRGRPGGGRVAVCVHGPGRRGRDLDALARTLACMGRCVACPELVGRGRSGRLGDPEDYGPPQYLVAHLGVDAVDWIGTSSGGLVGIPMAGKAVPRSGSSWSDDIGPFLF